MVASLVVLAGCGKKEGSGSREPAEVPMQPAEVDAAPAEAPSGQYRNPDQAPNAPGARNTPGQPGAQPGEPGGQPGAMGQPNATGQGTPGTPGTTAGAPMAQLSSQDLAKRFDALLAAFNSKDVTALSGFFADDAGTMIVGSNTEFKGQRDVIDRLFQPQLWTAFPDLKLTRELALVDGQTLVAIVHATGTNSGPVSTAGPTNKKIGLYGVVHLQFSNDGKIKRQALLFDPGVALAQLGIVHMPARPVDDKGWDDSQREVAIASSSAAETANMTKIKNADQAFAAGNVDQVLAIVTDDVVVSDLSSPKDVKGKKALRKSLVDMNKAFSDFTILNADYLAAGNWVLSRLDYRMSNTGDLPEMKLKKTGKTVQNTDYNFYKFTGDKVSHVYAFHNGMAMAAQLGVISAEDQARPGPGDRAEDETGNAAEDEAAAKPAGKTHKGKTHKPKGTTK